jgi:hypothetical protein
MAIAIVRNPQEREGKAKVASVREFLRRVFSHIGRIREELERARGKLRVNCETGLLKEPDGMDINGISELRRKLSPRQEKVIRLYFGLGCQRSHSSREMAEEFGVSVPVITGILGAGRSADVLGREQRLHF